VSNSGKTALVLGASGLVGTELVQVLLQDESYAKIHLLVREPLAINHKLCEQHVVNFDELDKYQDLFQVTDIFCCLGTTIKRAKSKEAFRKVDYHYPVEAAKLAKKFDVQKYLIITAMGASSKSPFFYSQVKGEVEEALKGLALPSVHIFRPSLLVGDRNEHRLREKIAEKISGLFNTIMVGPLRPYRSIQAKRVAEAMAAIAMSNKTGFHVYHSHEIEWIGSKP
jgi:uncharacterized protein YbjT (DUF2867 family)